MRPRERRRGRAQWSLELFDHLRLPLVDEHVRPPQRAHVERLVARVQDQNLLHRGRKVPDRSADRRRIPRRATRPAALSPHRAVDGLLLLGRERDRRLAAVELLHVDPGVVAALDRGDDDAGARRVEQRERGRLVAARVLVGVVADDRRVRDRRRRRGGRRARGRPRSRRRRGAGRRSGPAARRRTRRGPCGRRRSASAARRAAAGRAPTRSQASDERRRSPSDDAEDGDQRGDVPGDVHARATGSEKMTGTRPSCSSCSTRPAPARRRPSPSSARANGTSPRSLEGHGHALARVDQLDLSPSSRSACRVPWLDRQRHRRSAPPASRRESCTVTSNDELGRGRDGVQLARRAASGRPAAPSTRLTMFVPCSPTGVPPRRGAADPLQHELHRRAAVDQLGARDEVRLGHGHAVDAVVLRAAASASARKRSSQTMSLATSRLACSASSAASLERLVVVALRARRLERVGEADERRSRAAASASTRCAVLGAQPPGRVELLRRGDVLLLLLRRCRGASCSICGAETPGVVSTRREPLAVRASTASRSSRRRPCSSRTSPCFDEPAHDWIRSAKTQHDDDRDRDERRAGAAAAPSRAAARATARRRRRSTRRAAAGARARSARVSPVAARPRRSRTRCRRRAWSIRGRIYRTSVRRGKEFSSARSRSGGCPRPPSRRSSSSDGTGRCGRSARAGWVTSGSRATSRAASTSR